MLKKFLQYDIIQKTICSYVVLLIVPVIIFTCFVNFYCNNRITKTLIAEQQAMADRYVDELDNSMEKISSSIDEIKKNKIFYIDFAKDVPVVFLDIRDYLMNIEITLNYTAKAYYYDLYNDEVHTSSGVYKHMSFLQDIIKEQRFMKVNTWVVNNKTVNYAVPLEHEESGTLKGVMIYSIENDFFDKLFRYTEQYDDTISVVSYSSDVIYNSSNTSISNINTSKYYHVRSKQNSKTGFEIEHYLLKSSVMQNLYYTIFISVIMVLLMLSFGGAVFFFMMKTSYTPLKKSIWRILGEINSNTASGQNLDLSITEMLETKQSLLLSNHKIAKEYFLLKLLLGIDKSDNLLKNANDLGVNLTGPCYVCISVRQNKSFDEIHFTTGLSYEKVTLNDESYCIILSGGKHILDDAMISLFTEYKNADFNEVQIGIGRIENSIALLSTSYIHSKVARHMTKQLQQPISRYNDELEEDEKKYPYELLESVEAACIGASCENFINATGLVQDSILKSQNRFLAVCIYHDYFETVSVSIDSLCITGYDIEKIRKEFYSKNPSSKEEMLDIISALSAYITGIIQSGNDKPILSIDTIKSYIAANYQDRNFSLKYLAEHFNTSQSNLSHFFRRETETTLSEYINSIKIEYARKLLAYPNNSLGMISQTLGFANTSTFIRMFKKLEGIPPGEYKKNITGE